MSSEHLKARHVAILRVSNHMIEAAGVKVGWKAPAGMRNLPEGAEVVAISYELFRDTNDVAVCFRHPSFAYVAPGHAIPVIGETGVVFEPPADQLGGYRVPSEIISALLNPDSKQTMAYYKAKFDDYLKAELDEKKERMPDGWDGFVASVKHRLEPFGVEVGFEIDDEIGLVTVSAGKDWNGTKYTAKTNVAIVSVQYPTWPGAGAAYILMNHLQKQIGYAAEPRMPKKCAKFIGMASEQDETESVAEIEAGLKERGVDVDRVKREVLAAAHKAGRVKIVDETATGHLVYTVIGEGDADEPIIR